MAASQYYNRSRISAEQFNRLLEYFADDLPASEVAGLTGLTRKTVTTIFLKLRQRIAENLEVNFPLDGAYLDDDHLSARKCTCGRCRPMTCSTTPLFGVLDLHEQIINIPFPDCRKPLLRTLIRHGVADSAFSVDGWHGYDALIEANHSSPLLLHDDEQTRGAKILAFWQFTKSRLRKFNGISNRTYYLHLKESEWRFNLYNRNLFEVLVGLLEEKPI